MIKTDVKRILPEGYDVSMAPWFSAIRNDYDRYSFRIILISYIVTINIPLFFLINEIYNGRTALILNYAIPSVLMFFMILYLVLFRNIYLMRIVATLTAFIGFFCAILLPGSHGTYIIIFCNYLPIVFALHGLKDGAKWFIVFIVSLSILAGVRLYMPGRDFDIYHTSEFSCVAFISLIIMFLILYTSQRQHEKIIRRLVRSIAYDHVTGLPNKDSFIRCIKEMDDSVVAILHIINFKNLVTLFGYEFSDRILVIITDTLRSLALRGEFRIFKLNWHEFGIQIPFKENHGSEGVEKILEGILNSIRSLKIQLENVEVSLAISIGGVVISGGDYDKALSMADTALGYGLSRHKNVTIYRDGMDISSETFDKVKKYSILYDNVVKGTLKAYIQPVVDSESGKVCWYESLLRIMGDDGSYESISEYIDIAKDTDLYPYLTEFMLDHAGRFIKEKGIPVSVNISAADMMSSAVIRKVEEISEQDYYENGMLILEILESEELGNIEDCISFISRVQSMGVLIAVDDFGAGYSNISNLLKLRLNIVKIDGALIKRIEHDAEAYLFIKGIYDFCCSTGYRVVAEFIENESILDRIREIGIDYCQGYLFGRPEAPEELQWSV